MAWMNIYESMKSMFTYKALTAFCPSRKRKQFECHYFIVDNLHRFNHNIDYH